jgi:hypothetical protein
MLLFPSVFFPANPVNSTTYVYKSVSLFADKVCVCVCILDLRDFKEACFPTRISGEKTLLDAFFHGGIDAPLLFFWSAASFWRRSVINCMPADLPREFFWQEAERERLCGYLRPKLCRARTRLHSACSFVLSHRVTDDVDDNNNGLSTTLAAGRRRRRV